MDYNKFLEENFFLFDGINSKTIEKMLTFDGISIESYQPGAIIQNTDIYNKIGIIFKGKAVVTSGNIGVIINKLNVKDVYGVAALFDKPTHTSIVKAISECTIITFNKSFIESCINHEARCAVNYIEFLSKKVSFLNKKINAYTAKSAEDKLYTYLLQLPSCESSVVLNTDMSTIAKMLGIGRASLYRAFEKLESNGTITKNDKIVILNEV